MEKHHRRLVQVHSPAKLNRFARLEEGGDLLQFGRGRRKGLGGKGVASVSTPSILGFMC